MIVEDTLKLLIVVESESEWLSLAAFDFVQDGITPSVVYYLAPPPPSGFAGRLIVPEIPPETATPVLPNLTDIAEEFQNGVEACFILGDGPLARLTTTAADLLGLSVFSLVSTEEQLVNLSRRKKPRPDLFFVTDSRLFPLALANPCYGSTLVPTGHPGRDLFLRGALDDPTFFGDPHYGDGKAVPRIMAMIERWRNGAPEPALPDLSIIIPAYKEAENLPLVCDRLLNVFEQDPISVEILLIDDMSPDDTYAVALEQMWRSPQIRAFTKPAPRGMGNAIRHGLRMARGSIITITMGDGSDEVARIPEMFRKVHDEGAALTIGSRYRHRQNYQAVPRLYRFWSFCFRLTTWLLIGLRLSDYTNAFRVYHRDIFGRYGPESGGFEISPETTFKAWFATRRIVEVDVRHLKRASGQSSFSFLRAGPGYGKILLKAVIHRLTGKWFTLEW